jgi:hypothetical protein
MVVQVTDGPSVQPVDPFRAELAAASNFQDWVNDQTVEMEYAGLVGPIELDADDISWVLDQLI